MENKDTKLKNIKVGMDNESMLIDEMIALRRQQNITRSKMAELIGCKKKIISRIEKKEIHPSLSIFCNILSVLGYELRIVKKDGGK